MVYLADIGLCNSPSQSIIEGGQGKNPSRDQEAGTEAEPWKNAASCLAPTAFLNKAGPSAQ